MKRTLVIALMLAAVPLAGCVAGDDVGDAAYAASWDTEPEDAQAGGTITMTWNLEGPPGEVAETRVYYGTESAGDPQTAADYEQSAGRVAPAEVPGEYDASVTINQPGTYYFAARMLVEDGGEAVWTEEVEVEVSSAGSGTQAPILVEVEDSPSSAEVDEDIQVNWSLTGLNGEIDQTSFYWGTSSVQDPSAQDYENQEGLTQPAQVPGEYNATFTVEEPGTIYARARAFNDGQASWSDEVQIEIQEANGPDGNQTGNGTAENLVRITDEGAAGLATNTEFEPDTLNVTAGETITWRNNGNSTHSVDFQDEAIPDSGAINPGEEYTWEVPIDLEPGSYDYEDGQATTSPAQGTIQVEAPPG